LNRRYAIDDIRRAASYLEDALLEYIRNDGSQGRLFYDLALKCRLLHPLWEGGEHSTVVQQRNPFNPKREMGWADVVELPSIGEGSRKQHHSHFIFGHRSKLLKKIKRATGCMIKVCHNEAKLRTNLCSPYVFVFGSSPIEVDRAVEILKNEIQTHMKECGCSLVQRPLFT